MREIKFRYWDSLHKTMSNGFDIYGGIDGLNKDIILMQYTGLKDKKGTEIYEGDIVKCISHYKYLTWKEWDEGKRFATLPDEAEEKICTVEYDNGVYKLSNSFESIYLNDIYRMYIENGDRNRLDGCDKNGEGTNGDYKHHYDNFEVIGNIYQNPELLK